jgi:hypothetical protein
VACFPHVTPPKLCIHLSSPPHVLHTPSTLFFSICSPKWYFVRSANHSGMSYKNYSEQVSISGIGGLVVSMLASGTQYRGFAPGQSRWIFRAKKSSAYFPSEGK